MSSGWPKDWQQQYHLVIFPREMFLKISFNSSVQQSSLRTTLLDLEKGFRDKPEGSLWSFFYFFCIFKKHNIFVIFLLIKAYILNYFSEKWLVAQPLKVTTDLLGTSLSRHFSIFIHMHTYFDSGIRNA